MKKNICLLPILIFIICLSSNAKPAFASVGASCQSLTITPQKTAYAQGETINIVVKGTGSVKGINVYYVKSDPNLTSTNPLFWRWDNMNGSYDPANTTWIGTLTLPQQDGEYIITENTTDMNGQICSGNPGYTCSGCINGTEAQTDASGNVIRVGAYPCNGCHKVVVVDSNYGKTNGYDMKKYWNMSPGYSWNYEGTSTNLGGINTFNTRLALEEKVRICGQHTVLPLRFTKSNPYGYWWAATPGDPGLSNLRFMLTYFESGEPWSKNGFGSLYHRVYNFPSSSTSPIAELGTISTDHKVNLKMFDGQHYAFNYFAPYLYAPNLFVPANYDFERIDTAPNYNSEGICTMGYNPAFHIHYWHIAYFPDTVDTPAYKGPALRVAQIEAGLINGAKKPEETPNGHKGFSWITREDWYLVENIGIVQIDEYGEWCKNHIVDGLCLRTDKKPVEFNPLYRPGVQMKLTSYYVGQPLQITVSPVQVEKSGTYILHINNNYTGYLEAKSCVSESSCTPGQPFKWGNCDGTSIWVQNGVAMVDLSKCPDLLDGLYHSYFRPWIDTTPTDTPNETVLTKTALPWSNEVLIRVSTVHPSPSANPTSILLPGDIWGADNKPDGHVDMHDFNKIVTNFNNPYTIFNYNELVENFGK
jgi:hypothetical protein